MEKIIIENHSDLPMTMVLDCIKNVVVADGIQLASRKYCDFYKFEYSIGTYLLQVKENKKSDIFIFTKVKE